jgi:hypothetical protein
MRARVALVVILGIVLKGRTFALPAFQCNLACVSASVSRSAKTPRMAMADSDSIRKVF